MGDSVTMVSSMEVEVRGTEGGLNINGKSFKKAAIQNRTIPKLKKAPKKAPKKRDPRVRGMKKGGPRRSRVRKANTAPPENTAAAATETAAALPSVYTAPGLEPAEAGELAPDWLEFAVSGPSAVKSPTKRKKKNANA